MRRDAARILDEYLVASARAGDRADFSQLAERWQPKLLAHAYRLMGDREAARDIVQDGWGDIVKGVNRLNDVATFPAWAYRIISRRAADSIRRLQRQRKINNASAHEPKPSAVSAASIEAGADSLPLSRAIAKLPAEQRAAIALFYLEGFSVMEISIALSVPVGTVKTRLMTARRKLRAVLEGDSHV